MIPADRRPGTIITSAESAPAVITIATDMFNVFAMVDWSAATVPRTGRDSIWICWHTGAAERLENPPTRHLAKSMLGDWLAHALERGERVLLGFDFPLGYPAGFAARLCPPRL